MKTYLDNKRNEKSNIEDGLEGCGFFFFLISIASFFLIIISQNQPNNISTNNNTLKDKYYLQKEKEKARSEQCAWLKENAFFESFDGMGNYLTYIDLKKNTVTLVYNVNYICEDIEQYRLGKKYKNGGLERIFTIEWAGNKGKLVEYEQYQGGKVYRREYKNTVTK